MLKLFNIQIGIGNLVALRVLKIEYIYNSKHILPSIGPLDRTSVSKIKSVFLTLPVSGLAKIYHWNAWRYVK